MTMIMTMLMVNIAEAKAKLSEYVDAVAKGEQIIICNRNRPVAELRAIEPARVEPRDLTPMFPDWKIDPAFFDPLSDEELSGWEGGGELVGPTRVAELPPAYSTGKPRRKRR